MRPPAESSSIAERAGVAAHSPRIHQLAAAAGSWIMSRAAASAPNSIEHVSQPLKDRVIVLLFPECPVSPNRPLPASVADCRRCLRIVEDFRRRQDKIRGALQSP